MFEAFLSIFALIDVFAVNTIITTHNNKKKVQNISVPNTITPYMYDLHLTSTLTHSTDSTAYTQKSPHHQENNKWLACLQMMFA